MQEYWKDLTGGQGPAMDLSEGILTVGGQNFGNIGNYDEIEQYMQEELYNKKAAAY